MDDKTLKRTFIPELGEPRSGKVRDIYESDKTMLLIASDRVSAFNRLFEETIPDKGRILNAISKFWFDQTADIIPNHLLSVPDPNVMVVKKCKPILIEVVMRGYMVGSLWRDYAQGKRIKCGINLPEGLKENDPLPQSILTPTLKNKDDTEISASELIEQKIVSQQLWDQITEISFSLFQRGTDIAKERGLILVDTKYEFGLDENNKLILIDEIHTPDSSRYWSQQHLGHFFDKEFIRKWLINHGQPASLPQQLIDEARENYIKLYETILQSPLQPLTVSISERVIGNLVKARLIHGFFVVVVGEHDVDLQSVPHAVVTSDSVHKYEESLEPIIFISAHPIQTKWTVITPEHQEALLT